jgi:hypothetical protein
MRSKLNIRNPMQKSKKHHAMIDASVYAKGNQMQIADLPKKRNKTLLFSYKSFGLCKVTLP